MIDFFRWARQEGVAERPWCILGKGPTFARRMRFPLDGYLLLGLNHTVMAQPVFLGHAADLDVVDHCAEAIERNCRWFAMPVHPHVDFRATTQSLAELLDDYPVLRRLEEQGRLLTYNLSSSPAVPGEVTVETAAFGGVVAMRLLAQAGVRTVRSLGLDGGRSYSIDFAAIRDSTLLNNGAEGFDRQLADIRAVAEDHGIDYEPLIPPMRIFIGADHSQTVAAQVLDHTIRQCTELPVDIRPMVDLEVPTPRHAANRPRTGFSFSRFLIPELCAHKGRALYLDADMQVFDDISALWDLDFEGNHVLCTHQTDVPSYHPGYEHFRVGRQYSVMLLDCEQLHWDINEIVNDLDRGTYTYEQLMFDLCIVSPDKIADTIPTEWNHLEHYDPGITRLLHYTIVETQPWKNDRNPLTPIWDKAFADAVADGAVNTHNVERLIASGDAKLSLREATGSAPTHSLQSGSVGDALRASQARIALLERENRELRDELGWTRSSPLFRLERRVRVVLRPVVQRIRRRRRQGRRLPR